MTELVWCDRAGLVCQSWSCVTSSEDSSQVNSHELLRTDRIPARLWHFSNGVLKLIN